MTITSTRRDPPEVAIMWNRPGDGELDETVEFEFDPAVYDDVAGCRVHAERSRDGWCVIEIYELDGEDGGEPADVSQRPA